MDVVWMVAFKEARVFFNYCDKLVQFQLSLLRDGTTSGRSLGRFFFQEKKGIPCYFIESKELGTLVGYNSTKY